MLLCQLTRLHTLPEATYHFMVCLCLTHFGTHRAYVSQFISRVKGRRGIPAFDRATSPRRKWVYWFILFTYFYNNVTPALACRTQQQARFAYGAISFFPPAGARSVTFLCPTLFNSCAAGLMFRCSGPRDDGRENNEYVGRVVI